jgi:hypothetical protein
MGIETLVSVLLYAHFSYRRKKEEVGGGISAQALARLQGVWSESQ